MGFGEAAGPVGIGADGGVGGWVEVSVAALFVLAEEDGGVGAGGDVVEELVKACVRLGSGAEVSAEEGGRPGFGVGWGFSGHMS